MDEKKWRKTAGRLLAGFLIVMVIGTVLSRAADSFLVARVQTAKPSGKSLVSRFTGTGELEPEGERGVYPPDGLVIEEIFSEAGTVVEEGTPLFRYEEGSLRSTLERVRSEYRDLALQYEELEQSMPKAKKQDNGTVKAAEQGVEQAEEGVKQAEKGVKQAEKKVLQAEKGLEEAEKELAEAEADLLLLQEDSREALLEVRQESLDLATEALFDAQQAEADGREEAAYQREQAQNAWVKLQQDWAGIEEKFNAYADLVNETGTTSLGIGEPAKKKRELLDSLYIIMYGGTEAYQSHKDEVTNQALSGNQLGLNQAMRRDNAFESALKAYAKAVKAVKEASGENSGSTGNPSSGSTITGGATSGGSNAAGSSGSGSTVSEADLEEKRKKQAECLEEVWKTLLSQEGLEAKRKELKDAEEELLRQRRAEEKTVRTLETATDKAYQKWKKATEDLEAIQNGSYDYKKELASGEQAKKAAKKAIEAAKDTIETAKEELEEAKEAVKEAEQEVADQEGELQKAKQEAAAEQGEQAKELADSRRLSGEKLDVLQEQLQEKKRKKKELEKLIKAEGIYCSEVAGTITRCGLEAGTTYAGGQAAFRIGTGRLVYQAQIDKEAEGRVEAGDEVVLTFSGKSKGITALVQDLTQRVKDGEEILELTAELPEDKEGYRAGRQASYTLEKRSDYYNYCIPLAALRKGDEGHFVLVLRERDRILGKEQYVISIPVKLLASDGSSAAIDGGISEQDEVITSSSRTLSEGDRIRKKE